MDFCKIGYSSETNMEKRLVGLQTSSPIPLTLINTIDGDRGTEKKVQNHFKKFKVQGEWFQLSKIDPFISVEDIEDIDILPSDSTKKRYQRFKFRTLELRENMQKEADKKYQPLTGLMNDIFVKYLTGLKK